MWLLSLDWAHLVGFSQPCFGHVAVLFLYTVVMLCTVFIFSGRKTICLPGVIHLTYPPGGGGGGEELDYKKVGMLVENFKIDP